MSNAFENYGDAAKPMWQRKREGALVKRRETIARKTAAEERLDEKATLEKAFRKARREEIEALLAGPYGRDVKGLQSVLRTMTLSSAPALITVVERATWIKTAPDGVRQVVLALIARGISRLRVREGLPPYDDALWNEQPTAFQVIREALR